MARLVLIFFIVACLKTVNVIAQGDAPTATPVGAATQGNIAAAPAGTSSLGGLGVNYGLLGDNLPTPDKVIDLIKSNKINKVRIFEPKQAVLQALKDSNLELALGTRNEDLQSLATDPSAATKFVQENVVAYSPGVKFRYITLGNEVIPGQYANFVFDAMQNMQNALKAANVNVPVSTVVATSVLGSSYPPSNATFGQDASAVMEKIVSFLQQNQYPLLANVYTCFPYFAEPTNINADYALGNANVAKGVTDGSIHYNTMFDAMIDAVYVAMEKVGGKDVKLVVSETGWPSAGVNLATMDNAKAYVNNVIQRVSSGKGTPLRPSIPIEAYIFAMFNENQKPAGTEQNFGLFYPDMKPVYPVSIA
ncbi:hypothetical protein WN944_024923 [Citrus x changshan-huyou]|uniref:glucan endo-1,3-beta-D-glucosidase n=1 Tax=Citrus x changshan-huyou TaxID=2935761 RepID=A0AAP0LPT0_9ROSI